MSLILETGAGLDNSNSYASVAFADDYLSLYSDKYTNWAELSEAQREAYLLQGSQYIELKYNNRWKGKKATSTQALSFPRTQIYIDGYLVAHNIIPLAVRQATVEAALRAFEGDSLLGAELEAGNIQSETVKVGTIESSISYTGTKNRPNYPKINLLLTQLIRSNNQIYRG